MVHLLLQARELLVGPLGILLELLKRLTLRHMHIGIAHLVALISMHTYRIVSSSISSSSMLSSSRSSRSVFRICSSSSRSENIACRRLKRLIFC